MTTMTGLTMIITDLTMIITDLTMIITDLTMIITMTMTMTMMMIIIMVITIITMIIKSELKWCEKYCLVFSHQSNSPNNNGSLKLKDGFFWTNRSSRLKTSLFCVLHIYLLLKTNKDL